MTKKENKSKFKSLMGGKIPEELYKDGISPIHKESYEYGFDKEGIKPVAKAINKFQKDKKISSK